MISHEFCIASDNFMQLFSTFFLIHKSTVPNSNGKTVFVCRFVGIIKSNILFKALNTFLILCYLSRIMFNYIVLHIIYLVLISGLCYSKLLNINLQSHFFSNQRIIRCKSFYLCIFQGCIVYIIMRSYR